jgi:predicted DNA-binding helix-hairpin-helix protein
VRLVLDDVLLCGLNDLRITLLNLACIYVCAHCLFSESYTTKASVLFIEAVNLHFHLYGCSYHHNCTDGASLDASTGDVDDDTVANYLEYYAKTCRLSCMGVRLG